MTNFHFAPFLDGLNEMLAGGITYGFIVNILAGSGAGKCHGKGQEILMHDLTQRRLKIFASATRLWGKTEALGQFSHFTMVWICLQSYTQQGKLPYVVNSKHFTCH